MPTQARAWRHGVAYHFSRDKALGRFAPTQLHGIFWGGGPDREDQPLLFFTPGANMFVDRVKIMVAAGNGGNGCRSFRREKFVPRGGPDGGDGGDGGSVIIRALAGVDSLAGLSQRKHWRADPGAAGGSANCHGRNGHDLVIDVPPGAVVIDAETGLVLRDLTAAGEEVIAARGGKGGKGNLTFKSSTNRAPRETTPGGAGDARMLILELKVIADVGLIGKPNAGKSTLLSRVSRARPEIADYPFTTKYPNLGLVHVNADRSFVMADIPGLIEGAHLGAGLGHEFLRHIERAGILVHLVEPTPADGSDPIENYRVVRGELEQYSKAVGSRPEIVAVTKAELPGAAEVAARLAETLSREVLLVSAVTGERLDVLLRRVVQLLDAREADAREAVTREAVRAKTRFAPRARWSIRPWCPIPAPRGRLGRSPRPSHESQASTFPWSPSENFGEPSTSPLPKGERASCRIGSQNRDARRRRGDLKDPRPWRSKSPTFQSGGSLPSISAIAASSWGCLAPRPAPACPCPTIRFRSTLGMGRGWKNGSRPRANQAPPHWPPHRFTGEYAA